MPKMTLSPKACRNGLPATHVGFEDREARLRLIREKGQPRPGIASRHPKNPDKYLIASGYLDCRICQELGLPFEANVRESPFKPCEAIEARIRYLWNNEPEGVFEIADLLVALREAIKAKTAKEVAKRLRLKESVISQTIALLKMDADERLLYRGLPRSHVIAIGSLPERKHRERAIKYAKRGGRCLPLHQLNRYLKWKKQKLGKVRLRILKFERDGLSFEVRLPPSKCLRIAASVMITIAMEILSDTQS
jgi:hypothetical protein